MRGCGGWPDETWMRRFDFQHNDVVRALVQNNTVRLPLAMALCVVAGCCSGGLILVVDILKNEV